MNDLESSAGVRMPRLVLITNGLRPVTPHFPLLGGQPVGIVAWYGGSSGRIVDALAYFPPLARLYAFVRRRQYSSLAHFCHAHDLKYARLEKSRVGDLKRTLVRWQADLVITSGCPYVPMDALTVVKYGGINLHPSLLPAYRGADPLTWQVIDQVEQLGVTVHRLNERFDSGCILAQSELPRQRGASREILLQQLEGETGAELLKVLIGRLVSNRELHGRKQPCISPTRTADRLTMHKTGKIRSLDSLTPDTVWDIITYFDQCPPQWLGLSGWRTHFRWRPASLEYLSGHDSTHVSSQWRVKPIGMAILLMHPTVVIELRGINTHGRMRSLKQGDG